MIKTSWIGAVALAVAAAFIATDADARRLGSGKSIGTQRNMPERTAPQQANTPPAQQAQPAQGGATGQ
ncbi:MAG: Tim44 domain-containing protein, partial [Rubrivivax sp.]|nr:Tim44 domain-containing protein [Rubrivivax sp.]